MPWEQGHPRDPCFTGDDMGSVLLQISGTTLRLPLCTLFSSAQPFYCPSQPVPICYKADRLPSSSTRTRECSVACCRMLEVSLNSTKKVLSPLKKRKNSYEGTEELKNTAESLFDPHWVLVELK